MPQSVGRLTSAWVMISQYVGSSPASGSVLTAQSLEPASDSVSPSLSAPPPLTLSLSLSKINIKKRNFSYSSALLNRKMIQVTYVILHFLVKVKETGEIKLMLSLLLIKVLI